MIREPERDQGPRPATSAGEIGLSVVVPCLDEEEGIGPTLEGLQRILGDRSDVEIVVVDDGSTDGTQGILAEASRCAPRLEVLEHETNRGYGAALKTGIRHARGEWILIVDADGTYPVDAIPALLERAPRLDMVVGARVLPSSSYPWLRRVPKLFLRSLASWLAGQGIPDMNSGLRLFRRRAALSYLKLLPEGFSFTTTITVAFLCDNYRVGFVPIALAQRMGTSKIRPLRDTLQFVLVLLRAGMYFAPLRLLSPLIGFLFGGFLASLVYDVVVLENLTDKTVLLVLFALNTALFALLADMVQKRSGE